MFCGFDVFENVRKMHPAAGIGLAECDDPRVTMERIFDGWNHSNLLTKTDAL